jgi:hypothetical protein
MYTVQFLSRDGGNTPSVLETLESRSRHLADAKVVARYLLNTKREQHSDDAPHAYQIIDQQGTVVLRSWET